MNIRCSLSKNVLAVVAIVCLLLQACGTGSTSATGGHPGQISTFDGQTYDTMLAARQVLLSFHDIAQSTPKFKSFYNTAAASYNASYAAYAAFRAAPAAQTQTALTNEIVLLTPAVAALVETIQADLHPTPTQLAKAQEDVRDKRTKQAKTLSPHYTSNINLVTVLNFIEIAAAVASSIPVTAPYGQLALQVVQAAQQATQAVQTNVGQPIDMTQIAPVNLLA